MKVSFLNRVKVLSVFVFLLTNLSIFGYAEKFQKALECDYHGVHDVKACPRSSGTFNETYFRSAWVKTWSACPIYKN